ncbi:hypothetical protein PR003_g6380 [Phytophthora rubi]|uniref:Uncharacterized protein n=1 Tax=Phytophthora rubi TaxID=129364 RepID=A0A6A4FGW5_9STRA|nr:hypothetical protein PR003_g6380 [Phytophthora rubi]
MARIRLSPREKAVAAATAALREVDFPHLCRQLWAAGWTDKKPTGLPLQWRYTTPDGAKVFYAEAELMEHNEEQGHGDQDDEHGRGNQVGKHGRGG